MKCNCSYVEVAIGIGLGLLVLGCGGGATADSAVARGALFADMRHAAWAPDGRELVVTRSTRDGGDLVVLAKNGTAERVLAATGAEEMMGGWSPDGRSILFAIRDSGGPRLWSVGPDGGRPEPFLDQPAIYGHWSPDGTRFAFNSVPDSGRRQVFVAEADGRGAQQVTADPDGHSDYPSWSPDGQWILFESNRAGSWETFRARPDGRDLTRLSRHGASAPRWSPDGRTIAFHEVRAAGAEGFDIYLMDADGGNERLLVGGRGDQRLPEWSPDGREIAYVSNATGHHDVFRVDVATGITQQVTLQPEGEFFRTWETEGAVAAAARADWARTFDPPIRVFRDTRTVLRHAQWLLADGDSVRARFLIGQGVLEFPADEDVKALADSLGSRPKE